MRKKRKRSTPDRFTNFYHCPDDGIEWQDQSEYQNNDRCPRCDHEIEPYKSEDASDLMERTRAAVAITTSTRYHNPKMAQMYAFLSLFHPEMTPEQIYRLSRKDDD